MTPYIKPKPFLAKTTKPILYHDFDKLVKIKKGTLIVVDPVKNIALHLDDHFTIQESEYVPHYQN